MPTNWPICHSVTVSKCHSVTVSQCHSVTLSHSHSVTVSPMLHGPHSVTVSPPTTWSSACYLQLCNYENINALFLVIYIFINAHGHLWIYKCTVAGQLQVNNIRTRAINTLMSVLYESFRAMYTQYCVIIFLIYCE